MYLSNNIIRFDDHSKLKSSETFGIDGTLVDVSLVKSRSARAGNGVTLVYDQNRGFDPELSLFLLLKEHKRVNGSGAFLYLGDRSDIKFSQKQFKEKLATNPELRTVFMEEVKSLLPTLVETPMIQEIEENNSGDINADILGEMNNFAI